jgi:hypothetical protein
MAQRPAPLSASETPGRLALKSFCELIAPRARLVEVQGGGKRRIIKSALRVQGGAPGDVGSHWRAFPCW